MQVGGFSTEGIVREWPGVVKESGQMSDAQGVSAQDDTAPMAANPSEASKAGRASSGRLVRLLATVGALVFAYAAWLPWAIIVTNIGDRATSPAAR